MKIIPLAALSAMFQQAHSIYSSASTKFTRWSEPMRELGYSWEPIPVKTQDGYQLTVFHIVGSSQSGKFRRKHPPVLIMHGLYSDAAIMVQRLHATNENLPWMLQLAEMGFDVWIGNNRGTEYSMRHSSLDPGKDAGFWNFTWEDMGRYDLPAMISKIKKHSGFEKIFYIGYSQGSAQMFSALSFKEFGLQDSLLKFVALSPCVMFDTDFKGSQAWMSEQYFMSGLYQFPSVGVHAFKGPNWQSDIAQICESFRPEVCDEQIELSSDQLLYPTQPTSMINLRYWWNNGFQKRFQRFAPNYMAGETTTDLIDVANIGDGVSISMFVPEADELCPFDPLKEIKTDYVKYYPGEKHDFFGFHNGQEFIDELSSQFLSVLQDPQRQTAQTFVSTEL